MIQAIAIRAFDPFSPQVCRLGGVTPDGTGADTHIFVGENGTGKTRLLCLLLAASGNGAELRERGGATRAAVATVGESGGHIWDCKGQLYRVGTRELTQLLDRYVATGEFGVSPSSNGDLSSLKGAPVLAFRSVAAIRDEKVKPLAPVEWKNEDFLVFGTPPKDNASLCQSLTNMKIRAGMYVAGNPGAPPDRVVHMTAQLEATLTRVTGRTFVFVVLQEGDTLRLKVRWGDVLMNLQQLPDGLRAIIGWLASSVAKLDLLLPNTDRPLDQPAILFLDEPETHLHPAWQRQVIPALQSLLPNAQIFVATHSPFVVSSVNQGWIYVLKAQKDGRVVIRTPVVCSKGDSYIDAVEDVLGMREWYDPETETLLSKFRLLRDSALQTSSSADKQAMHALAKEIAARSDSLEMMMGQELKQFAEKEKASKRAKGVA